MYIIEIFDDDKEVWLAEGFTFQYNNKKGFHDIKDKHNIAIDMFTVEVSSTNA